MFCTKCGAEIDDDARFCTACGATVEDGSLAPESAPEAESGPDNDMQEGNAGQTVVVTPMPPEPETPDMSHAFDPAPTPGSTAEMPVAAAPKNYNAVPPEQIVGSAQKAGGKKKTGLIVGIVCGAVALVAIAIVVALLVVPNATRATYTVTFETNGGSTVAAQEVEEGKSVTTPADPVRENYYFVAWYLDAACEGETVAFPYTPTADTVIYAKWTRKNDPDDPDPDPDPTPVNDTEAEAINALKGYLAELKEANEVVHTYADDSFNKKYKGGASKVSDSIDDLEDAYEDVDELIGGSDGYDWEVEGMTVPETYVDQRDKLAEASDTLYTRLNNYYSALQTIQSMYDPSSSAIDASVQSYIDDGHNAYVKYQKLVKELERDLG